MLNEFIGLIPNALLRQPGRAFNAGRLAFSAPDRIYVLLLNPSARHPSTPPHTTPATAERIPTINPLRAN